MLDSAPMKSSEGLRRVLAAVTETSSDAILIVDGRGRVIFGNPAVEEMFGFHLRELWGRPFYAMLVPEWTRDRIVAGLAHFAKHAEGETLGKASEVVLVRKDGTEFRASLRMSPGLSLGGKSYAVSVIRDLSRWSQTSSTAGATAEVPDEKLVRAERLASIGQLAAGVAHEINNPVGYITSNLGTLEEYMSFLTSLVKALDAYRDATTMGDAAAQARALTRIAKLESEEDLAYVLGDIDDLLRETLQGSQRVREIVANLQRFARTDTTTPADVDVNECIESTLDMVHNQLKYHCKIRKILGPLPAIRCQPAQLNQVFTSLLINASQAIEGQGEVTVTSEATVDEVLVHIEDSGCGIPPDVISRIFDPFFTTRDVGQGTGLGLWIAHGIVRKHGGCIDVRSDPGRGSTFTVRLPRNP